MLTKTDIEQYFLAEKNAAFIFLIAGIISIVLGLVFILILKTSFYKGAAVVLMAVGLLQTIIGYTIYSRSDKQRVDTVYAFDLNPDKLKNHELPRIKKAVTGIQVFLIAEAVLLIAGAALYFKNNSPAGNVFWQGVALLLVIEGLILLGADVPALKRNQTYLKKLEQLVQR